MPWLQSGKCCTSKKGTNVIDPSSFDKLITLTIEEYTPSATGIKIDTKTSTTKWASIKSNSSRSFGLSNPFNSNEIQNQFSTNYIFTCYYFADYYIYQFIKYEGKVYKIQSSENKNLTNDYVVFITQEMGSVLNPENLL